MTVAATLIGSALRQELDGMDNNVRSDVLGWHRPQAAVAHGRMNPLLNPMPFGWIASHALRGQFPRRFVFSGVLGPRH